MAQLAGGNLSLQAPQPNGENVRLLQEQLLVQGLSVYDYAAIIVSPRRSDD